jgi:phospholipid/cholesterol/gamma-HCH transport system substrate-binding protein
MSDNTATTASPSTAASVSSKRKRNIKRGLALYIGVIVAFGVLTAKPVILTQLSGGKTVTAEFDNSYKLRKYDSSIKFAGLQVGSVTGISTTDSGTVLVTMKLDDDVLDKLGSTPSAAIEPRTLLGGRYTIQLTAGGQPGKFEDDRIPLSRTTETVELDRILEALPSSAREGLQGTVSGAEATLKGGKASLKSIVKTAPDVLDSAQPVFSAVRGTRPSQDLPQVVAGLQNIADALTRNDTQLASIVDDLATTAATLAQHRRALASGLDRLPAAVRSANIGLAGLDRSVTQLTTTARNLRPTAPEVAELIEKLDPVLAEARPLLRDLRPALRDARPVVEQLVPAARRATGVLNDLRGPVLDRVNGPIATFVLNPWKGTGQYKDSAKGYQADHKFYEEVAYMASNIDASSMMQDSRGSTLAFQAGAGSGSIDGLPFSIENIVRLALSYVGTTR